MKNKILFQFFAEKRISKGKIESLLKELFHTDSVGRLLDKENCAALYELKFYQKGFRTLIEVYVEAQKAKQVEITTDMELGLCVADSLDQGVLVSDDNLNPYTWLLIEEGNVYEVEQVSRDDESMIVRKKNHQSVIF